MSTRFTGSRVGLVLVVVILVTVSVTSVAILNYKAPLTRSLGVHAGDSASYSLICSAFPAWAKFNVSIRKIEGTAVSYDVIYFYSNGSSATTMPYTSDVQQYGGSILPYIIAANLSAGDQVAGYQYSPFSKRWIPQTINQTIQMLIGGSLRLANYMDWLWIYYSPGWTDVGLIYGCDLYWDRATGLTVEANMYWNTGYTDPHWAGWFNWTLLSMNISPPRNLGPDLTAPLVIGGGVGICLFIVVVAVVAGRRK